MMDACILMRYSTSKDALNHDVPSWTDWSMVPCGLDMSGGAEQRETQKSVVNWYAKLRLAIGTTLDIRDRIRIVVRLGEPCEPIVYEIAAPIEIGPSGLVVSLRKVEPSL